MTDKQFSTLFAAAVSDGDREAFISDWATSSLWGDNEAADIPAQRVEELSALWGVAHAAIRDIRQHTGLSQAAFATRYCIPRRSVENWESGDRACPDYLRLLLAQATGLYARD